METLSKPTETKWLAHTAVTIAHHVYFNDWCLQRFSPLYFSFIYSLFSNFLTLGEERQLTSASSSLIQVHGRFVLIFHNKTSLRSAKTECIILSKETFNTMGWSQPSWEHVNVENHVNWRERVLTYKTIAQVLNEANQMSTRRRITKKYLLETVIENKVKNIKSIDWRLSKKKYRGFHFMEFLCLRISNNSLLLHQYVDINLNFTESPPNINMPNKWSQSLSLNHSTQRYEHKKQTI